MRIREPGKVREKLWFLGRKESCIYLVEGNEDSMVINGGMSYLVPDLLQQFEAFGIDETRITKLLILHAHFDHLGIIPFFKGRNAQLEIYASRRGWEILKMPRAIKTINEFSRRAAKRLDKEQVYDIYDLDWRDDITGTALSEGDRIDLGDLEVRIYETPGHSSCSLSAYARQIRTLFPSDSGGIPYKDTIIASGNSNFTKYQQSLEKLKDLDLEYICSDHYGYVAGDEAKDFIRQSVNHAKQRRTLIEKVYLRTGNVESAALELVSAFYEENPDYVVPPEIAKDVYRRLVRHIAFAMDQGPNPAGNKGLHEKGEFEYGS